MTVPHQPPNMNSSMSSGGTCKEMGSTVIKNICPNLPDHHLGVSNGQYRYSTCMGKLKRSRGDNYFNNQIAYEFIIEVRPCPNSNRACCCYWSISHNEPFGGDAKSRCQDSRCQETTTHPRCVVAKPLDEDHRG